MYIVKNNHFDCGLEYINFHYEELQCSIIEIG